MTDLDRAIFAFSGRMFKTIARLLAKAFYLRPSVNGLGTKMFWLELRRLC